MKIKRLNLKAYGPFTGRVIEFATKQPGLHIIFGPNEAGKSSALRALKALLYGFPHNTSDNFLHPNDQLRVGGTLKGAAGKELSFYRRKKRIGDLLDPDGNVLTADSLFPYLHGIELALFESLYGIDHETLVAGGRDILAQKGEMGQALFAAGTGISSLRKVLDSLEAEADELFKERGSKQQITQAIGEFKKLKKRVKEDILLPGKWKEQKKCLEGAISEHLRLEEEIDKKSSEKHRLERLSKAIPELAALEELQGQLLGLGDVVLLPEEFSQRLQEVRQTIRETNIQIEKDRDRLKKLQDEQGGISLNRALLDHAETVEDLHQRLGAYSKGQRDRTRLVGESAAHSKKAEALIVGIRSDLALKDVDSFGALLGRKRTIQDLSRSYEALNQQASQAQEKKAKAENELARIAEGLSKLPPAVESDGLAKAIKLAQKAGDIDRQIAEATRDVAASKKSCQAELSRLGLWSGGLEQLPALNLPLIETVRRFETGLAELDQKRQQLKNDRRKAEEDLRAAQTQNNEVTYGGAVPTEQDLIEVRRRRQEGWLILRRKWIDGADVSKEAEEYESDQILHEAYEKKVEEADHLADRLRREADRVAKAASLRAKIEGLEAMIRDCILQEEGLAVQEEKLDTDWRAQWESLNIEPLPPKEMLAWLTEIEQLRFKMMEILNKESEVADRDEGREQYRTSLIDELKKLGESEKLTGGELAPVLVFAESILNKIDQQKAKQEKLSEKQAEDRGALEEAEKEQTEAETAKRQWWEKWDEAVVGLSLRERVVPSEALDLLDIVENCSKEWEQAKNLQQRIDGIDRDAKEFRDDLLTLVGQVAPDLKTLSPDQATSQLNSMLVEAREANQLLKRNSKETGSLTADIEEAEKALVSLDGQMKGLLGEAKCSKVEDLDEAIRKSADYQRLEDKISDAKAALAKVSEGLPVEQIKMEAAEVDRDELPGQIASLSRQIDEDLSPQINEALTRIGEERKGLMLMDGSAQAAEAAEEMERVAARIGRLVNEYTKIRLAAAILKNEIERYREEHQDPILKIASRIFSNLTLGSFAGLRADLDDNGNPIIVGVKPDDSRVQVEVMSDGTRDQLYLALRLATLETRLETGETMPFIVDDILINFDDERSSVTLKVLTDLAKKNQVILFTHHQKIVDEANSIKEPEIVQVHDLSSSNN